MQADCTFCQIVSGELPADYVDEDEHTVAFMDINPAPPGHLLVVSRRHVPDLMSASEEEWLAVAAAVQRMARLATGAFKAGGVDLVQANSDGIAGAQRVGMRGVLTHEFRQEEINGQTVRPDQVI